VNAPVSRGIDAAVKAAAVANRENRRQGLAFARRWREERRYEALVCAQPRPAIGHMPFRFDGGSAG